MKEVVFEQVEKMLSENTGVLRTADAVAAGIKTPTQLKALVKNHSCSDSSKTQLWFCYNTSTDGAMIPPAPSREKRQFKSLGRGIN